jgi:GT2 family glycosyltransferase
MRPVRLTIALVTRNRASWLQKCLQSWRAQDIQPFEIVVSDESDHGLQSETRKIAEHFGARWIAGPQRGLYANRNHAFRAAEGTHIMSADDDHTHPEGFVATIVDAIESDMEAIWTVTERSPNRPTDPLEVPGELRSNGTIGPPEDAEYSAAIACGSTAYPRKIFESGLYYNESYPFGGLWYLWGHQLREAGFRIRYCPDTFVWHHTESSLYRQDDVEWLRNQLECNLFVQLSHAFNISRTPVAIGRAFRNAARLLLSGGTIVGNSRKVRLTFNQVARAFACGFKNPFLRNE